MNYFSAAIDILKQQDPAILTTRGLSGLLFDVRATLAPKMSISKNRSLQLDRTILEMLAGMEPDPVNKEILTRIMADPKGWVLGASEDVQKGAAWMAGLGQFISPSGLEDVMLYHTIRDNVAELQESLVLGSCVGTKTVRVLTGSCSVYSFDDQLTQTPEDAALKKADASKVIRLFLEEVIASGLYEMSEEVDEIGKPCEIGAVYQAGLSAVDAVVRSEAYEWEKKSDGHGWSSGRCDRDPVIDADTISLYITDNEDNTRSFIASHKDLSRFPWLT